MTGAAPHVIIVSGLSGSGKTTAVRALEDIGFFCIDNMPVVLLDQVVQLCRRATIGQLAVVVDVRERAFLPDYASTLERVRGAGATLETLFLSCSEDIAIRRFKETRRRHPLQGDGSITEGIREEREVLAPIRQSATRVMDTSQNNVHELRQRVQDTWGTDTERALRVALTSFGFKHGMPHEADWMFDVRFLPNPYFDAALKTRSGLEADVADYVFADGSAQGLVDRLLDTLQFVLPKAAAYGRRQVTVAIGCTGGQHRSVAVVEALGERLTGGPFRVTTLHRDVVP